MYLQGEKEGRLRHCQIQKCNLHRTKEPAKEGMGDKKASKIARKNACSLWAPRAVVRERRTTD
jgi:hypothetical protein